MMEVQIGFSKIVLICGNIADEDTEAIVNAANSLLKGGGGVDGAIHRAAGPSVMKECKQIGGCATGKAVITNAGNLQAKYIIHAVGPIWQGGRMGEPLLLESAYLSSLELAQKNNIQSISFPSISTGAYGYSIADAARIVLKTVVDFLKRNKCSLKEARFVLFTIDDLRVYESALKEIIGVMEKR